MPRTVTPDREQQIRRVLLVILGANLVVVALKAAVGLATHSLAVLGDLIQASLDAVNNGLGLAIMAIASKGPDAEKQETALNKLGMPSSRPWAPC